MQGMDILSQTLKQQKRVNIYENFKIFTKKILPKMEESIELSLLEK